MTRTAIPCISHGCQYRNLMGPDESGKIGLRVYFDRNVWLVGYYRGVGHHYFSPLPTITIRWPR